MVIPAHALREYRFAKSLGALPEGQPRQSGVAFAVASQLRARSEAPVGRLANLLAAGALAWANLRILLQYMQLGCSRLRRLRGSPLFNLPNRSMTLSEQLRWKSVEKKRFLVVFVQSRDHSLTPIVQ